MSITRRCVAVVVGLGLVAGGGRAQEQGRPAVWKEWCLLGSDDIAFHVVAFAPKQLLLAAGQHNESSALLWPRRAAW